MRRAVSVRALQLGAAPMEEGVRQELDFREGNLFYTVKAGDTLESIHARYSQRGQQSLKLFASWNGWTTVALPPGMVGKEMIIPPPMIVDAVGTYTGPAVPAQHMNPQDEPVRPPPATAAAPTATATVANGKSAQAVTLPTAVNAPTTVAAVEPAGPTAATRAWEWRQIVAAVGTLPTAAKIGGGLVVAGLLYSLFRSPSAPAYGRGGR